MVNFGPLAAEIGPVVWGTSANFSGFRVSAALLHGTPIVVVSQTLRRWTTLFGRAATTLGIGPHSSSRAVLKFPRVVVVDDSTTSRGSRIINFCFIRCHWSWPSVHILYIHVTMPFNCSFRKEDEEEFLFHRKKNKVYPCLVIKSLFRRMMF